VTAGRRLFFTLIRLVDQEHEKDGNAMGLTKLVLGVAAIGVWVGAASAYGQSKAIDLNKSSMKVRVFKSGAFSAFAHNHEIEAPVAEGEIDSSAQASVHLRVDARKMRVLDPEIDEGKRAQIQQTMQSATVLDVENFPEISYQSTSVIGRGEGHWEVRGDLTLHGKKQPVAVEVSLQEGHYRGSASIRQSDFGIEPIRVAGGTVKVKDEVKIEFDIVPVQ
jgi:polyisoprenoid-binding protein YceI